MKLPDGLTARPGTRDDAEAIFDVIGACELADHGGVEADLDDVVVGFERAGFDPATDLLVVLDGDEAVAWAELYRRRAEAGVRPSHRGRGIGTALLRWIEGRARELEEPDVGQTKTDANEGARDLFLANGYEPTFTSWILRISLEEPQDPPEPVDGVAIRAYRESDARAVHAMVDAAFSEWPGREPEPFEVWAPQVFAHAAFAPDLSPLAFDGNELVGAVISYDVPEASEGWIHQLATRATHRHRGIARALLRTAFGAFRERGRRVAGLSTDSRTGALGLYEKVGMRVDREYTRYTKRLS
jgi:mycothiol synthase